MAEQGNVGVERKRVPVEQGLFTWPSDDPRLIGSKCGDCGEVVFPAQPMCPNCCTRTTEELLLSKRGKLYSYAIQRARPPSPSYRGGDPFLPYGVGEVELPEGVIITSVLAESDPEKLKIGMDMELVVDRFFGDEAGNEVVSFKFKPV